MSFSSSFLSWTFMGLLHGKVLIQSKNTNLTSTNIPIPTTINKTSIGIGDSSLLSFFLSILFISFLTPTTYFHPHLLKMEIMGMIQAINTAISNHPPIKKPLTEVSPSDSGPTIQVFNLQKQLTLFLDPYNVLI